MAMPVHKAIPVVRNVPVKRPSNHVAPIKRPLQNNVTLNELARRSPANRA
jgi:hypothetical protein